MNELRRRQKTRVYLVWICYWDEESAARAERVGRGETKKEKQDKKETKQKREEER